MATKMNPGFMAMIAKKKDAGKGMEKKGMKEGSKKDMAMDKMQMSKMKHGGITKMAMGGGIESKGKTKGTIVKMAKGGKYC